MAANVYDFTMRLKGQNTNYDKAMKQSAANNAKFNDSVTGMSKGLTAINGPLNGITGRFTALSSLATGTAGSIALMGAAVAGASLMMVSAVKAHDEFNLRNKKTEALLKATGYASGFTASQLDLMAKSVALNTLASVEGIKDSQNVLLTFKGVSRDVFKSAIELSQDMAAVMGTDSKSAALQLGKALESPTQGITALKRSGVSFTKAEREMIAAMEDAGRVADAQTYILDTLRAQIGGAGSAEGDGTVVGAIDSMSQHWQEMKINVADSSGAATAAAGFFSAISDGLAKVNQDLWPDDDRRMQELAAQRMELKAELTALGSGDHTGFISRLIGTNSEFLNVSRSLDAVTKEMAEIQDRQKQRILEEQAAAEAAAQKSAEREKQLQEDKKARDDKALARIHEKNAAELLAMDVQFASAEEKAEINFQKNLDRIAAWQVSEQEIKTRGFETMAELQQYYRDLAYEQLDADLLKIEQRELEAEEKKTNAKIDQDKKRLAAEKAEQRAAYNALGQSTAQFLTALEGAGKKKSALYKVMFAAQKAAAIPSMIANTEEGAAAALKLGPVVGPPAALAVKAMGYASVGVVAGQSIAGIAHGGMGYIPEESTYLLQKGEGVLSPKQNAEVQKMASNFNAGKSSASPVVVNVVEDNARAGQVSESQGANGEQMIDVFVANIREGGSAAQQLEGTYGLSRVGR